MDADAVVVGAGVVGSSCAMFLARAGLRVCIVDRGGVAGGTSGSGEGNVLVSDKVPGPELELAKLGCHLWRTLAQELPDDFEYEEKGGIVVAESQSDLDSLARRAADFRSAGVAVSLMDPQHLREAEPHLAGDLAGAIYFPEDAQVQPMQAAAALMRAANECGAFFLDHTELLAVERDRQGRVSGAVTSKGRIGAPRLINAAGPWSPWIARMVGLDLPVQPRKGHIVVTEPLPQLVHHKVYEAGYGETVGSNASDLQIAAVVEGTRSGTILMGSSRQLVGFHQPVEVRVIRAIAQRAVRFFPVLGSARALRAYAGFRPFTPDHLPIIGEDPRVPGYYVDTGHEGAGIGLGPISGKLLSQLILGLPQDLDLAPFRPTRFVESQVAVL